MQPMLTRLCDEMNSRLTGLGSDLSLLGLRLVLAHEFGEAGLEKLRGENWFAHVQDAFPWPFSLVPAELSWALATWTELAAAVLLVLGLATRFAAFSLLILTGVAIASVHWPDQWGSLAELWQGYAITDKGHGNFKLPLLFAVMLWPLFFMGAGRLSADHVITRLTLHRHSARDPRGYDPVAVALAFVVFGMPLAQVMPVVGYGLVAAGAVCGLLLLRARSRTDSASSQTSPIPES
jgi:putative oxidoreductase